MIKITLYLQVAVSMAFTTLYITGYDNKYLAKVATVLSTKHALILRYSLILMIMMFVLANLHFYFSARMLPRILVSFASTDNGINKLIGKIIE